MIDRSGVSKWGLRCFCVVCSIPSPVMGKWRNLNDNKSQTGSDHYSIRMMPHQRCPRSTGGTHLQPLRCRSAEILPLELHHNGPQPGTNCTKIGLPGKLILGNYFQENMTSQRPFLLLKISFPGRPIFIQLPPGHHDHRAELALWLWHHLHLRASAAVQF